MAKIHARHSPSTLDSLSRCIRFRYKPREDDSADEGTLLHEACRNRSYAGLDEEQRNSVEQALGYTDSLLIEDGGPEAWHVMREVKLILADLTFGHADFVAVHKTLPKAIVLDYKFTRVEGNHSFQVRTYGAALVSMLGNATTDVVFMDEDGNHLLTTHRRLLETVSTHVVAPRLHEPYVNEYPASELLAAVTKEITDLYERADDPWTSETPQADLCALCARAARCPSLNAVVKHVAPMIGLPLPSEFAPEKMVEPRDRAVAQILAGALSGWGDEIKKYNNEYVAQGGEIPGFRLQSRGTGLKIREGCLKDAIAALRVAGFTDEMMLEAMKLSPAALAKHRASTSSLSEGEAKEEIKEALGDLAEEGSCSFLTKVKRGTDAALMKQITEGEKT